MFCGVFHRVGCKEKGFLQVPHKSLWSGNWILFIIYNNRIKKLLDTLSIKEYKECLPHVQSVMDYLAKYTSDVSLREELVNPTTQIKMDSVMDYLAKYTSNVSLREELAYPTTNQMEPNALDYGFYTMAYMKYLIEDAFGNKAPPEKK